MKEDLIKLLEEVEALCKVHIGKNAPSEQWGETCRRLMALDKIAKKARRDLTKRADRLTATGTGNA